MKKPLMIISILATTLVASLTVPASAFACGRRPETYCRSPRPLPPPRRPAVPYLPPRYASVARYPGTLPQRPWQPHRTAPVNQRPQVVEVFIEEIIAVSVPVYAVQQRWDARSQRMISARVQVNTRIERRPVRRWTSARWHQASNCYRYSDRGGVYQRVLPSHRTRPWAGR